MMTKLDARPSRHHLLTSREVCSILASSMKPIVSTMPEITAEDIRSVCRALRNKLEHFEENVDVELGNNTPERLYLMMAIGGMCLDAFNDQLASRRVTIDTLKWIEDHSDRVINYVNINKPS